MNKELIQDQRLKQLPLLVFLNVLNQQQEMCLSFDLIFFLFIYSFILADNTSKNIFSKRKITHHKEISILKRNGARYLDPKYSRWLSTDPALGEYVPAAGKGNSSDAGNLPGMGGIYNSVNGNLYHYAGNNPVKYVDPTGLYDIDDENKTITANIDDLQDIGDAYTPYYILSAHDYKFQLAKENEIVHSFSDEKYVCNYIESLFPSTFKTWREKPEGSTLTQEEATLQKIIGITEMIIGPVGGTVLTIIDPAGFLAGMYVMADGALVFTSAQDKKKKTPLASIPSTFLLPYVQVNDIVLPAGGTFIW